MKSQVRIGATAPDFVINQHGDYSLSVDGKIVAREIIVTASTLNWSDFVFDPKFKIPSLKETEAFILKNHHLPGVPSAREIKENGYSVHEMNRILLEKIEVLTLQMIDLEKKLSHESR